MPAATLNKSLPVKLWTRDELHNLVEAGIPNAEHWELIEGALFNRMGKGPNHVLWCNLVLYWLQDTFGREHVRKEDPTEIAQDDQTYSEPEPDLMVTKKSLREYDATPQPEDILLAIEIADTTLPLDLGAKARLYARAGIMDYWVVDINTKQITVHRSPQEGTYRHIQIFEANRSFSPLALPAAAFQLDRL